MPDAESNLNSSPGAAKRRRGRRGGRGRSRGPRPAPESATPVDAIPAVPETIDPAATAPEEQAPPVEAEAESKGGFREPHSDVPEGFSSHEDAPATEPHEPEPVAETPQEPPREQRRDDRRDDRREHRRDERPPQPPPRIPVSQRKWVKPADFRPAAPSAIAQAVEHATFIAEALKELHDQMDEILELVEVAERQKIADERELEEFRRALRRIQPQRQPQQQQHHPHHQQQRHQPRREEQRREEPRRPQPEPREANPPAEAPQAPAEPTEPPHTD